MLPALAVFLVLVPGLDPTATDSRAEEPTGIEVVGHLRLGGRAPEADIYLFDHGRRGPHVYVGTYRHPCTARGVKIVDVEDPAAPVRVGEARGFEGMSYEDVAVARVGRRVVLAVGLQDCTGSGEGKRGQGGLALYDVTRPRRPQILSYRRLGPHGVHELDLVVREDGRALALVAAPFSELAGKGKDIRIVDITRPRSPVVISSWNLLADSDLPVSNSDAPITGLDQGLGYRPTFYGHSVRAADRGMTAFASYWDAGVLELDLSDPFSPRLRGRTVYPVDAEGEAHSLALLDTGTDRYIVQNDEDYVTDPIARIDIGGSAFPGLDVAWFPSTLAEQGAIAAPAVDVGRGCDAADFPSEAAGAIVVIEVDPASDCSWGSKAMGAARSGAIAVMFVVIGNDRSLLFAGPDVAGDLEATAPDLIGLMVSDPDGLDGALDAGPVETTLVPGPRSWGFIRIFRVAEEDLDGDGIHDHTEVGAFADLPHVQDEQPMTEGTWSVHNTEVFGSVAYSSWYSNGLVAVDLADPTLPRLLAQFVPPPRKARSDVLGRDGRAETWGLALDPERGLVYLSDMRSGLWILRPTGRAALGAPGR